MLAITTTMLVAGVSAQCRLKHINEWMEEHIGNGATSGSPSNVMPMNNPRPTGNNLFGACSQHSDCNAQQYCSTQQKCHNLNACFIRDDPIDYFCPGDDTTFRTPGLGQPSGLPSRPSNFPSGVPAFPSGFPSGFPSDFGGRRRLDEFDELVKSLYSECVPCVERCGENIKLPVQANDAFMNCLTGCPVKDFEHSLATCTMAEAWEQDVTLSVENGKVHAEIENPENVSCATCRDQCIRNVEADAPGGPRIAEVLEEIEATMSECLACCTGRFMDTFTDCSAHVDGLPAWNDDINWTVATGAATSAGVIVGIIVAVLFGLSCISFIICMCCPCICAGAIAMQAVGGPKGNQQGNVYAPGTTPGPQHV